MKVLLIGGKYRNYLPLLRDRCRNTDTVISYLSERWYDMRFVRCYLTFDVIVCPYRLCLLHLSLHRQLCSQKPYLILATGAQERIDRLVAGRLCEKVCSDWDFISTIPLSIAEMPPLTDSTISKKAFIDYMAYIGRDSHGSYHRWSYDPINKAYPNAVKYYLLKKSRDMKRRNFLLTKPIFPVPENTCTFEFKSCFMIMPFTSDLTKLYSDIIKPTVQGEGIEISRADDFFSVGSVMEDVWRRINHAQVVIADLTGRNPNVYYELGIAHTLGKPVILLTQDISDVPFDVRDKRVITYGLRYDDVTPLQRALRQSLSEVKTEYARATGIDRDIEQFP